jgi:hypothetical protein
MASPTLSKALFFNRSRTSFMQLGGSQLNSIKLLVLVVLMLWKHGSSAEATSLEASSSEDSKVKNLIRQNPAFLPHNNSKFRCDMTTLGWIESGSERTEVTQVCHNDDQTVLVSRTCWDGKCPELSMKRKWSLVEFDSELGRVGHHLCKKMGGQPQIIWFVVGSKKWDLDRCIFRQNQFIDTGSLMEMFLTWPKQRPSPPPLRPPIQAPASKS